MDLQFNPLRILLGALLALAACGPLPTALAVLSARQAPAPRAAPHLPAVRGQAPVRAGTADAGTPAPRPPRTVPAPQGAD